MGWVKLDDNYRNHPKVVSAGAAGMALDIAGMCWSAAYLTDGFVPDSAVPTLFPVRGLAGVLTKLTDVGRWERDEEHKGYWIHDYLDYNPPADKVLADREKERQKKNQQRRKPGRAEDGTFVRVPRGQPEGHTDVSPRDTPGESHRTRPVPSRPLVVTSGQLLESVGAVDGGDLIPISKAEGMARRLADLCKGKSPNKLVEARTVVGICLEYADWRVVDEAIGRCSNESPTMPRYLFKAFRDQAKNYGLAVPELSLPGRSTVAS